MLKAPLRAKTGCDRCKKRRKKCNEVKPICGACERLKLKCTWTFSDRHADRSTTQFRSAGCENTTISAPSTIQRIAPTRDISRPSSVFHSQVQFEMTMLFPQLFHRPVSTWYMDKSAFSTTMVYALKDATISSAVSAFTAFVTLTVTGNDDLVAFSNQIYQIAVAEMGKTVAKPWTIKDHFIPYYATSILGLHEIFNNGNVLNATYHFSANLQLLPLVERLHRTNSEMMKLIRFFCEGNLFHLATGAVFLSFDKLNDVVKRIDWETVKNVFNPPLLEEPAACHRFTYHMLQHAIFRLILEVCLAARSLASAPVTESQKAAWLQEISRLEESQHEYYAHATVEGRQFGLYASNFYFCALRIFIEKIAKPTACSSTPYIQQLVKHALGLINQPIVQRHIDFNLFWPLLILMCSTREQKDFDAVSQAGKSFWVSPGFAMYWQHAVDVIKAARKAAPCDEREDECLGNHDGLNILLWRNGVFANLSNLQLVARQAQQA